MFLLVFTQISFNIGVWSLPDISLLRFNDLIDVLTAGTEWIYAHFQMVITTGIVLGGYEYPRGVLTVLERAGIEMLLIYHTSSNVVMTPSSRSPFGRYYGHGGLDEKGEDFLTEHSNFYTFRTSEEPSIFANMRVVHVFGEETRLINNLVHNSCSVSDGL